MKIKIGSILDEVQTGLILQVVNAQGAMNFGFAKQIRKKWPKVWSVYSDTIEPNQLDHGASYLGTIIPVQVKPGLFVVNCVAQQFYGSDAKKYLSYDALDATLCKISELNSIDQLEIHHPMIGAGVAGGKWEVIKEIIEHRLNDSTLWLLHK